MCVNFFCETLVLATTCCMSECNLSHFTMIKEALFPKVPPPLWKVPGNFSEKRPICSKLLKSFVHASYLAFRNWFLDRSTILNRWETRNGTNVFTFPLRHRVRHNFWHRVRQEWLKKNQRRPASCRPSLLLRKMFSRFAPEVKKKAEPIRETHPILISLSAEPNPIVRTYIYAQLESCCRSVIPKVQSSPLLRGKKGAFLGDLANPKAYSVGPLRRKWEPPWCSWANELQPHKKGN